MPSPRDGSFSAPVTWDNKIMQLHPAFYVASWIFFSNLTIIFNKWLLDTAGFPIILTTLHLITATALTQLLARFTPLLNSRHTVPLTGRVYLRAILPIGMLYTASLVFSNLSYLFLSVSFLQMLKAFAPATTLLISWGMGITSPQMTVFYNVLVIVVGVLISSVAETQFHWLGFMFALGGTLAESMRLLLIEVLLKREAGDGVRMDPLVGLYYYAPVCAVLNGAVALFTEVPHFNWTDLERVGVPTLGLNCLIAFLLNVTSVFLIGKTSALAMNLTGILKAILLVVASMIIWGAPVTLLQAFGYSIALVGMFYYSMGPDTTNAHIEVCKSWFKGNSGAHESLKSEVPPDPESGVLSRLRRMMAAPWGGYSSLASEEVDQVYEVDDLESGRPHGGSNEPPSPTAEKTGTVVTVSL
ncbi:hypothetical protein PG999_006384 [Apiospora kogelbergensis]|uniref:Sugar phosphate transporter domain-containing protein n=1 Tax=Apiospora kogelbergensis TaxID=1337665 RepID=A0AAW0QR59_9PEZI